MSRLGDSRRGRLTNARLYLVTDARRAQGDLEPFLDAVLAAGVDLVQLRQKDAEAGDLLRWSTVFRAAADRHGALFILNDRPDVALVAGADGVHIGQNDLPSGAVRGIIGPDLLIGLSTHSRMELDDAAPEADYLCTGPVHATPTKPGRPATGLKTVHHAAWRQREGMERRPWFAIGGIDTGNLAELIREGATRVVVVRAIAQAVDPASAARGLVAGLSALSL